jgi:hypothetical protein
VFLQRRKGSRKNDFPFSHLIFVTPSSAVPQSRILGTQSRANPERSDLATSP